jgi:hypothetical protein
MDLSTYPHVRRMPPAFLPAERPSGALQAMAGLIGSAGDRIAANEEDGRRADNARRRTEAALNADPPGPASFDLLLLSFLRFFALFCGQSYCG